MKTAVITKDLDYGNCFWLDITWPRHSQSILLIAFLKVQLKEGRESLRRLCETWWQWNREAVVQATDDYDCPFSLLRLPYLASWRKIPKISHRVFCAILQDMFYISPKISKQKLMVKWVLKILFMMSSLLKLVLHVTVLATSRHLLFT